jgi:hypothetical protein
VTCQLVPDAVPVGPPTFNLNPHSHAPIRAGRPVPAWQPSTATALLLSLR